MMTLIKHEQEQIISVNNEFLIYQKDLKNMRTVKRERKKLYSRTTETVGELISRKESVRRMREPYNAMHLEIVDQISKGAVPIASQGGSPFKNKEQSFEKRGVKESKSFRSVDSESPRLPQKLESGHSPLIQSPY